MTRDLYDYAPRRIGDANDLVLARKRNADERIYMVTTNLVIDAQEKRPGRVHRRHARSTHPAPRSPRSRSWDSHRTRRNHFSRRTYRSSTAQSLRPSSAVSVPHDTAPRLV
ncbi:hypothetical protein, partial [Streptomyces californicus]|uniref:hypothetical protein n=1 Tax=Streptomyces californicus TaxID=67351 RepID=UPI003710869A